MRNIIVKRYLAPTPARLRKLGNALIGASQGIAVPMVLSDMKWLAIAVLLTGWLGKFLTELFTDEVKITTETQTKE